MVHTTLADAVRPSFSRGSSCDLAGDGRPQGRVVHGALRLVDVGLQLRDDRGLLVDVVRPIAAGAFGLVLRGGEVAPGVLDLHVLLGPVDAPLVLGLLEGRLAGADVALGLLDLALLLRGDVAVLGLPVTPGEREERLAPLRVPLGGPAVRRRAGTPVGPGPGPGVAQHLLVQLQLPLRLVDGRRVGVVDRFGAFLRGVQDLARPLGVVLRGIDLVATPDPVVLVQLSGSKARFVVWPFDRIGGIR